MELYELEAKYQKINDNFLYIERLLDEVTPLAAELGLEEFDGNTYNIKSSVRGVFTKIREAYEEKREELLREEQK